ncbi:MAG: S41 family peptidase [Pseudomonadales bacterium]|nr:S41 family peptidase [Gammaproteobacteria bacterium]NNL56515.1 S41 family peptidase [Pseudomonadales bacterium]
MIAIARFPAALSVARSIALLVLCASTVLLPLPATADDAQHSHANTSPARGQLALKELQAFVNAFTQIRNTYVEEVDDKTLLENAIRGMLTELDPHSNYLEPQTFEDLQVSATGEFGGLGLEVGMEDGFVKVISPIDDTPAHEAGIESGDLIVKIDNKPVKGLNLNEAVKLMRGEIDTPIELTIVREGNPQPLEFKLMRAVISVVSVRSRMIEDGYLYLRIAQFQSNTGDDLRKVLDKSNTKQPPKGIVLDLRNNPGGVLQAAVDVVDTFIDDGLIVYTEGRIKESATRFVAKDKPTANTLPLVILINGGSASASEIVAGALQDHKRAIVLGTTSFGKGSVQSVIPLSKTHGMKLTTARYFTPNGRSIQAQGIVPDIIVERGKFTRLESGSQISEADLHRHLANDNGKSRNNKKPSAEESMVNSDSQLHEAITLLKGLYILSQRSVPKNTVAHAEG